MVLADYNFSSLDVHQCMIIVSSLYSLSCSFGSPLDEAATIAISIVFFFRTEMIEAISIVKESSNDFKEEREIEADG